MLHVLLKLYKSSFDQTWSLAQLIAVFITVKIVHIFQESIQHRFTPMILRLKELSYMQCLRTLHRPLGLWSLEARRHRPDLIEIYKIIQRL